MVAAARRRRTTAAASPHLITQQVVHARPSDNHQRESAHFPTTTDAISKRPTTDSKDHDCRLTIVSCYGG